MVKWIVTLLLCQCCRAFFEHPKLFRGSSRYQPSLVRLHHFYSTLAYCWTKANWTSTSHWSSADQFYSRDVNNSSRSGSKKKRWVVRFTISRAFYYTGNFSPYRTCWFIWCITGSDLHRVNSPIHISSSRLALITKYRTSCVMAFGLITGKVLVQCFYNVIQYLQD